LPIRARLLSDNTIHFITFTVNGFQPIFVANDVARKFTEILRFYEHRGDYSLQAFVVCQSTCTC
jgi:hypothetical protein